MNNLNELTTITNNGTLTVAGTTTVPVAGVTVNGSGAGHYADATFALGGFTPVNGNNTYTAIGTDSVGNSATNSITVNLPTTNTFAYDLNGNLLTNGFEVLVWNDENQLVTNFVAASWKSEFVYDGLMRRRIERDYSWSGSSWTQTNEIHYVYDGNVIIQERDGSNNPLLTFTRGNDLSGTLQNAGGVGGLLAMTESSGTSSYYHGDGAGNVTCLINTNQLMVAKAEYEPYGNFLSLSGPKAYTNPFWYSSKPIHWQSGKYDFLYRWYVPDLDRFANRDPIQEFGGINLYRYVANNPIQSIDLRGLDLWIIGDSSGLVRHHTVVGNNPDGSYWSSDFGPDVNGNGLISDLERLNHKGETGFSKCSSFDPKNLDKDHKMISHLPLSPDVDAEVRNEAQRRSNDPNQPRYDFLGNNCWDYANGLYYYGVGAQARHNMGN